MFGHYVFRITEQEPKKRRKIVHPQQPSEPRASAIEAMFYDALNSDA